MTDIATRNNKKVGGWEPEDNATNDYGNNNGFGMGMNQNELAQPSKPTSKRFKPPLMNDGNNDNMNNGGSKFIRKGSMEDVTRSVSGGRNQQQNQQPVDERLKNLEPRMIEAIESEMVNASDNTVTWDDIAGWVCEGVPPSPRLLTFLANPQP